MTSWTKRQKETALLVLSLLFFFTLATYSYFTLLAPAKEANAQMKTMMANEREHVLALRKQAANSGQGESLSSHALQRKVPVKPLEDMVLYQIEIAGLRSNSRIQEVTFSTSPFAIQDAPEQVLAVHQLQIGVVLQTESYLDLGKFIDEIEQMERIFIVDSIHFNGPEEVREKNRVTEPMQATISLTAFYRPDLLELLHELPKVDAPESAKKMDPTPYNNGIDEGADVQ